MTMRTHSARGQRDRAFTLIELVVAISVVGMIATVIAATVGVALKNNPEVELRTDVAHTLQGVVTWLPQDVDSTPTGGFDLGATTASGCTQSPGVNLLRMEWTENVGGAVTHYVANYRHVTTGTVGTIKRVSCKGTGSGPWSGTNVQNASGPLPPLPVGWVPGTLPVAVSITNDPLTSQVDLVTFSVRTVDGRVLRVDAAPKNPNATLPPTTGIINVGVPTTVLATTSTTSTLPSGTTTTLVGATTTTTLPATTTTVAPCVVTSVSPSATSIKNTDPNGNGNSSTNVGVLASALTIQVTTSGYCTGLEARAATGAPNGELFRNFTALGGGEYLVSFPGYPQGSSELWADGDRAITFYSPTGGPYGSMTLTVK
ncbi:MAG TPA: type II secretion system protein [Ilumatobacteraceae bacterium]|nr:type II secretion system protein [Ilumatobacteraceae bacterium]